MGLLDNMMGSSIDDPKTLGLLSLAASLSSGQKFMPALAGGLLGRQQIMQDAQRQQTLQEMQRLQLAAVQRQAEQQKAQDAFRASLPSPQMQAAQTALANGGGPTVANAAAMPAVDPTAQMMHGAMRAGLIDPVQYVSSLRKDTTPVKLGAGETLLDPRTFKPLATNPKEDNIPSDWKLYELSGASQRGIPFEQWVDARKKAGASSTTVSYGSPVAGVDAQGRPVFFQPSKDGGAPAIVPGVAPPKSEKPLTEGQAKAAAFASQMQAAEQAFGIAGTDSTKLGDQVQTRIAQGAGNFVVTPEAQKARQAQEQWSESYLRFKTGAAATKDEVSSNVRTFFPQPGDSAAVVRQKAEMRKQAAHDVRIASGGAAIETVANVGGQKQVVRTGTHNGRKVVQYADGTTAYAD